MFSSSEFDVDTTLDIPCSSSPCVQTLYPPEQGAPIGAATETNYVTMCLWQEGACLLSRSKRPPWLIDLHECKNE